MRIILLFTLFFTNTIYSQISEDWKNFELNSKWKVNFIKNDSIQENRLYIGELVFLNTNPEEPKFRVVFWVYKSEEEISPVFLENRKFLKSIFLGKSPNVMEKFEFNNHIYLLSLREELAFRDKFYKSLVIEIEKYIKN